MVSVANLIRIFLSSPGDVLEERARARAVIERLAETPSFQNKITFEIIAWDTPGSTTPMLATMPPQQAVNEGLPLPSDCDMVVVIFWARMGTPLPPEYHKPDGSPYRSGTEWEYEDAMRAAQETGRPFVLVYRRTEKVLFDPDSPTFTENAQQYQHIKDFFKTFVNADGSIRRG